MKNKVTVTLNNTVVTAEEGLLLSTLLSSEKPCGGHGKCGKCKVIARGALSPLSEEEKRLLTEEEIAGGIRLACRTYVLGDSSVFTEIAKPEDNNRILCDGALPEIALDPSFTKYGVAIDIGTTTLASVLYNKEGAALAYATALNPQSTFGADVISRIEASLGGQAEPLAKSIRQGIDALISTLSEKAGISPQEIDGLVITGNTVMLYLLTGSSPLSLSRAPFEADRLFGETLTAQALGFSSLLPETEIYLPPCISAFVGADTTCALLATEICNKKDTLMLADIGTNGEMALWHNGKLTVCSTAAGPAFEGVGISMGMRAASGAIDKVSVKDGELCIHTVDNAPPCGICGSGLIDAVSALLELEELEDSGYLEEDPYPLAPPVHLTGKDIRMVQLAKSAICAGIETLLDSEGLSASDVTALYVAGGFGTYLDRDSARKTGLLPAALTECLQAIGNAALGGASLLLLNRSRAQCERIIDGVTVLELSSNPVFSESYMMGMIFEEK